jgi:hypothetical protein
MLHNVILGFEIFAMGVVACILLGLFVSTIRSVFRLNTKDIKVWNPTDIPAAMAKAAAEAWWHRSLGAFDIAVNVILLRGQQDETISTHSWRAACEGKMWGKAMCWWLNLFQANHGPQAACGDLERATARVAVLKKALGL